MSELMRASRQWSTRPSDERFWSVQELSEQATADRNASREVVCELGKLSARPVDGDLAIIGPSGAETSPTNWGFSQICRLIGAPADYLTGLPADLACRNINHGLEGQKEKVKVLLHRNGKTEIRAVTSEGYTRFWDSQLCDMLKPALDNGWKVPPARPANFGDDPRCRPATADDIIPGMTGGAQVRIGENIAPSGVYRGDRDSFVFLVNPSQEIDNGNGGGGLFKGIIASNSEVGKASIRFQSFCHEGVCGNHIIWGATNVVEMKRKHFGNLSVWLRELRNWFIKWTAADTIRTTAMIAAAKQYSLGGNYEEVEKTIKSLGVAALTIKAIKASYDYAQKWEMTAQATPNTAWGFVHGLTRYSQTVGFTDLRNALDIAGGKVLNLAM